MDEITAFRVYIYIFRTNTLGAYLTFLKDARLFEAGRLINFQPHIFSKFIFHHQQNKEKGTLLCSNFIPSIPRIRAWVLILISLF